MRVPEPVTETVEPPPEQRQKKKKKRPEKASTAIWDGIIQPPREPNGIRASFLYPFWGATGVALLVILPPILWLMSVPFVTMIIAFTGQDTPFRVGAMLALIPSFLGLSCALGYSLLFLGRVAAASAIGEVHHPRWPDWELSAIFFGFGRWLWAGFIGGVVGGFPATAYWIYCGDVDPFDALILAELAAAGAVYALMALLASILHDDALAANPITVLVAIRRVGWGYVTPCLLAGAAGVTIVTVGMAAFEVENPALAAFLFWFFWVLALYLSLVVLRILGLFYHAHARELGWFRDRTGWGV